MNADLEERVRRRKSWYESFALFGESSFGLLCSSSLLVLSVVISLYADGKLDLPSVPWNLPPHERAYRRLESRPDIGPPTIFEADQVLSKPMPSEIRKSFQTDGVIAVRGLLDPSLLSALDGATKKLVDLQQRKNDEKNNAKSNVFTGRGRKIRKRPTQFFTQKEGAIFLPMDGDNSTLTTSPFVEVALMSKIPGVIANLLGFDCQTCPNNTLRVMRDIFLAKDDDEYVCGWHVDDIGFWPALVEELGEPVGVNAWIALDDMPVDTGGGFALAVGSHSSSWKEEAYAAIGTTHSYPSGGFTSTKDILQNRPGNGTCNIQYTAPHLHRRMEETKRIYDIKAGDVIFHTRWLFHRTVPFQRDIVSSRAAKNEKSILYRRYSIRYGPGTSIIPPGYGTEPSVISDEKNGGRSADHVSHFDSAWYPRAWPSASNVELEQMKILAEERLPTALEKGEERKKEIRPRRKRAV